MAEVEMTEADAPCRHWIGPQRRRCGAFPTRPYLQGPRCGAHTPAAIAGEEEPGEGAYCPPALCLCGREDCPAAIRQRERAAERQADHDRPRHPEAAA